MIPEIKNYIDKLPSPQKEICKKLHKIIVKKYPKLEETLNNGVPSYGDKYYIVGLKDYVNIGFAIAGLTKEELKLFKGKEKSCGILKCMNLRILMRKN